ncbi:LysM peptidoglycan-binding domain-containing protein [Mitsuaria sp. GD03876]|uniref:CIS tube protein n=1 Tax=Mitsuaria sp. GD03876 TaxID=2975399 RepID=UPI00244C33AF|nr:LysM peptidoglycan-binding domain-containing protein [Mitsuaria sp. GD03876]MDH0867510.1 LysM peptidoglycan-binding domain-containing protein [Mitsuaria sp. GD03876]
MALAKARITVEHTGAQFDVMFNPEEYSLNKDNNFASQAIPGLGSPILQFVHGNLRTLEMELFFDTTDTRADVRGQTQKVVDLLKIDSELHAPPVLRVAWGSLQLRCVLTRANQKFIKFLEDGRPTRARITVSFSEFIDPEREAKEVNRQTADFSKGWTVQRGDTLQSIAWRFYEDPALWRPIAIVNGIDDPRGLVPGQALRVPALPFTDPATGEVTS